MNKDSERILRIVSIMNRGGIESQIMNIYRNIDRKKYQFDFLTTKSESGVYDDEIIKLGGRIFRLDSIEDTGPIRFYKSINQFFKEKDYKIIHCHLNTWSGLFLNIAKKYDVPIRIAQSHSAPIDFKLTKENLIKEMMRKFIKKGATDYWAVGVAAANWLFKGIDEKKIKIIPNAKNLSKFKYKSDIRKEMRNMLDVKDNFVLGHVGRFSEEKNHQFIIEIMEKLIMKEKKIILFLVGEGSGKIFIENIIKEKNLSNYIKILGLRNDVPELMNAFDLLLLPSKFEGMPNVIIEAQSVGLPSLVSDSITTEIDFKMGLVSFRELNSNLWSEYILENIYDLTNRDRGLIEYSKIFQKGYDLDEFVKWLEEYYNKKLEVL